VNHQLRRAYVSGDFALGQNLEARTCLDPSAHQSSDDDTVRELSTDEARVEWDGELRETHKVTGHTSYTQVGHDNAHARVRRKGRRAWNWEVEVTDDDGRLCSLLRRVAGRSHPRRGGGPRGWPRNDAPLREKRDTS
jgi:hypothetical protein